MGANANAIKNFNQKAQQQQQQNANPNQPAPNPTATPVVSPHAGMSVSDIQLLQADTAKLTDEQKLRRAALETKTNLKKVEDEKKAEQEAADQKARDDKDNARVIGSELAKGARAFGDSKAKMWFENTPTPGGIGVLLIIIAVFLMAIVPVDAAGHTRLMLLWLTLTGKTHIIYQAGGGGGANIGGDTPTSQTVPQPIQTVNVVSHPIPLTFPTVDLGITGLFNL